MATCVARSTFALIVVLILTAPTSIALDPHPVDLDGDGSNEITACGTEQICLDPDGNGVVDQKLSAGNSPGLRMDLRNDASGTIPIEFYRSRSNDSVLGEGDYLGGLYFWQCDAPVVSRHSSRR